MGDPHCAAEQPSPAPEFTRSLKASCGRLPYTPRGAKERTTVHWGQRKLLLAEAEFLTICSEEHAPPGASLRVVYAGAAPGTHVALLSEMFPSVEFVLVDPAPFTVKQGERVALRREMFTDELAAELRDGSRTTLFVSDVRTADPERNSAEECEARVREDMAAQRRWHALLGAERSLLKFRLPWDKGRSEYLDGDLMLPVWGPQSTTECRLITPRGDPLRARQYDHEDYESQMHYFNAVARSARYEHGVRGEGLDGCYDCRAEVEILRRYLRSERGVPEAALDAAAARLSAEISRRISRGRTLLDGNPDRAERGRVIRARQYVGGRPAYELQQPSKRARL